MKSVSNNKKIKNATSTEYNGIEFKSKTEVLIYKTLCENGFNPAYELVKFTLVEGFYPTIPFFTRKKKHGIFNFILDKSKVRSITYTPDFVFNYKDYLIIVEVKGFVNDVYPYKRALFRKYLEDHFVEDDKVKAIFFEVYTKKEALEMIDTLKKL